MIEPELAFADLNDDMTCATAYLQYVVGALYQTFIWCLVLMLITPLMQYGEFYADVSAYI
jgi:hypothetical protein